MWRTHLLLHHFPPMPLEQDLVSRLRQEQKAHPKALQQLEKQKQVLEKKLDGQGRKEVALQRDNEALQVVGLLWCAKEQGGPAQVAAQSLSNEL